MREEGQENKELDEVEAGCLLAGLNVSAWDLPVEGNHRRPASKCVCRWGVAVGMSEVKETIQSCQLSAGLGCGCGWSSMFGDADTVSD
jgi:hypothetical protein